MKPIPVSVRVALVTAFTVIGFAQAFAAPRDSSSSSPQALLRLTWSGDPGGGGSTSDVVEIFGWSHEIISPRDAASGLPTGKRQHKPFTITKPMDKTSPLLREAHSINKPLPEVELLLVQTDRDGNPVPYFTIKLTNAFVASTSTSGPSGNGEGPTESVTFVYGSIKWTYEPGGVSHEDDWETPQT
jgi:type VI secretion system secreted protein Hcp